MTQDKKEQFPPLSERFTLLLDHYIPPGGYGPVCGHNRGFGLGSECEYGYLYDYGVFDVHFSCGVCALQFLADVEKKYGKNNSNE